MKTIQVDIKELKANHPSEYDTHYQKYCTSQWDFPLEESFYVEGLNEDHKWLDVDNVHYSVSYSQGDYAYFTGRVDLDKFLEERDTENDYFVLREAMKLQDVYGFMSITSNSRWGSSEVFENIEWRGGEVYDDDDVLQPYGGYNSILTGMNYGAYYATCEELMGDLETWVKEVCQKLMRKLYNDIRDEIDYQMSEEAFEEWAEAMDEMFEVEIDDDDDAQGNENHPEAARLAA